MVYYDVMKGIQNIFNTRLEIVQLATERGISEGGNNPDRQWVRIYMECSKEERRECIEEDS